MNQEHRQLIKRYFQNNNRISNEMIKLIGDRIFNFIEINDQLNLFIHSSLYTFNTIIFSHTENQNIHIEFIGNGIIRSLKLILPNSYPFTPPNVLVNQVKYISLLNFNRGHIKLLGLSENRCICCESITCTNNWGPLLIIDTLIKEVFHNIKRKMDYTYNIYVDVIKNKYLNSNIPIMDFLLD